MYSTGIVRRYLPLMRTVKKTFRKDEIAERQVVASIRMSIAELVNSQLPEQEIVREMDLTEKMLKLNIAQVRFNENIDSYSVRLTRTWSLRTDRLSTSRPRGIWPPKRRSRSRISLVNINSLSY